MLLKMWNLPSAQVLPKKIRASGEELLKDWVLLELFWGAWFSSFLWAWWIQPQSRGLLDLLSASCGLSSPVIWILRSFIQFIRQARKLIPAQWRLIRFPWCWNDLFDSHIGASQTFIFQQGEFSQLLWQSLLNFRYVLVSLTNSNWKPVYWLLAFLNLCIWILLPVSITFLSKNWPLSLYFFRRCPFPFSGGKTKKRCTNVYCWIQIIDMRSVDLTPKPQGHSPALHPWTYLSLLPISSFCRLFLHLPSFSLLNASLFWLKMIPK